MKMKKSIIISIVSCTMFLFTLINIQYPANAASKSVIDPSNTKLHYEGRIDKSNPNAVKLIWEGSTFVNYVSSAVNTLKTNGDNKVFFHKFSQYTGGGHPRVETNIKVAKELVEFIKNQTTSTDTTTPTTDSNTTVSYVTQYDYGTGSNINVTIKNNSSTDINGWKLNFTFPGNQTFLSIWSGNFMQDGKSVTVTNASWNAVIPANDSVSFGASIKYTGTNSNPTSFTLNDVISKVE